MLLPSKRLFPESKERAPESDEQLSATQEYGVISQAEFIRLAGRRVVQLNQNLELRKRVEVGDFVISMRSFQGGLERAWAEGGIRSSYVVLRPRPDLVLGYYQRLFKSVDYIQALQSTANFIRDGQDMNYQNFVLIDLPFPSVSEQLCIATFLDHETARIDALIEEQQRLIELLKEQRQAVIFHAVTSGLDPSAPLKETGVEWLACVPKHWKVLPVKSCGWLKGGAGFPHENQGIDTQELDFHKVNSLGKASREGFLLPSENTVSRETAKQLGAYIFPSGAIVFAKVGAALFLGRVRKISSPACIDNNMMGFVVFREVADPDFILYAMSVVNFDLIANPGAVPSLNETQIGSYRLAIPPIEEQSKIARFLGEQTLRIDSLIESSMTAVELLSERRSALISAAVTGKIDVRGWKPPASTQAPELAVAEAD